MKLVRMFAMAALMTLGSMTVYAANDFESMRRPGGGRSCVVAFKTCKVTIGGICIGSKNRSYRIDRRESRWACQRVRNQYSNVRSCYVRCN